MTAILSKTKKLFMKTIKYSFLMMMIIVALSCNKDSSFNFADQFPDDLKSLKHVNSNTGIKIAVVSDIHYMDPSLLPDDIPNNPDFQNYLAKDPKLIELSNPVFRKVISELIVEKPDILLIPGDLTKDGELKNHIAVRNMLHKMDKFCSKIYIIPGNHDINNPEALSYKGKTATPVPAVSPRVFESLYREFGYGNSLYRDKNSLSYISQPFKKLWILAIDACKYENNVITNEVGGAIKPATMEWIKEKMSEARKKNITVLAMMHHGIMEHYIGQNSLDPGYVIDNPQESAIELMNAGIRLIFTGHYHANDITEFSDSGKTLTDIETGSLVTPPSPFRIMTLDENIINIDTRHVTSINAVLPGGLDFLTYSDLFLTNHLDFYFKYILINNFNVDEGSASFVAPLFRNAIMAHFAGDEEIDMEEREIIDALPPSFLVDALNSFWFDLPPEDNKIQIDLE